MFIVLAYVDYVAMLETRNAWIEGNELTRDMLLAVRGWVGEGQMGLVSNIFHFGSVLGGSGAGAGIGGRGRTSGLLSFGLVLFLGVLMFVLRMIGGFALVDKVLYSLEGGTEFGRGFAG